MELQGIDYHSYYSDVWRGNWIIEEIVYTDDKEEAKKHLGEEVSYLRSVDSFDIEFLNSEQDRIFYGLPNAGELGLDGEFYIIAWDADHEYPAMIVKSEHEMYLIKGNTVYKAVQEEAYLSDTLLIGF